MGHPDNDTARAAIAKALMRPGDDDERRAAAEAVMARVVGDLRRMLAVAMARDCSCGRTEEQHVTEGAALLMLRFDEDLGAMLAGIMLAELHRVAPVSGFDLN